MTLNGFDISNTTTVGSFTLNKTILNNFIALRNQCHDENEIAKKRADQINSTSTKTIIPKEEKP